MLLKNVYIYIYIGAVTLQGLSQLTDFSSFTLSYLSQSIFLFVFWPMGRIIFGVILAKLTDNVPTYNRTHANRMLHQSGIQCLLHKRAKCHV